MDRLRPAKAPRELVEHEVRKAVYAQLGAPLPHQAKAPHPLVVNYSARHVHLSEEAVTALFGKDYTFTPFKRLYQGEFAVKESVDVISPTGQTLSGVRILVPLRDKCQVDLSFSDARSIKMDIPVRLSGNHEGTPGCMLRGPKGFYELKSGVLRAAPHAHMNPVDAEYYGVKDGDYMDLIIGGTLSITMHRILARVKPEFRLEIHIDTDEANACGLSAEVPITLRKCAD